MCEVVTAFMVAYGGYIAAAAAVAGASVTAYSSVQSSRSQRMMAEYEEDVAKTNSALASRQAVNIDIQADQKRLSLLRRMQQQRGTARAQYAAQGVVLGSGTVLDYEADVAEAYDLDLRNLDYDVKNQQWQIKMQGAGFANQANILSMQADAYQQQGVMSGMGGLLSGVGSAMGAYGSFNSAKGNPQLQAKPMGSK